MHLIYLFYLSMCVSGQAKMTFMRKDPEIVTLYFRLGGMGMMMGSPQIASNPSSPAVPSPTLSSPAPSSADGLKRRAYRIARKEEFITVLQVREGRGDKRKKGWAS